MAVGILNLIDSRCVIWARCPMLWNETDRPRMVLTSPLDGSSIDILAKSCCHLATEDLNKHSAFPSRP